MKALYACVLACSLVLVCAGLAMAAGYNSNGFESPTFTPGLLVPQDGWTGGSDNGGLDPEVVTAPHPTIGQQAVKLEVPDVQGAHSWMDHAIDPVPALPGTIVTVSYDIYRPAPQGTISRTSGGGGGTSESQHTACSGTRQDTRRLPCLMVGIPAPDLSRRSWEPGRT